MNTVAYFEIQASDINKTKLFYENVFGWTFTKDPSIPVEYYRISNAGPLGGLLGRPAKTPPAEYGTNAFTCSIHVDHYDDIAQKILVNGGKEALPSLLWLANVGRAILLIRITMYLGYLRSIRRRGRYFLHTMSAQVR